jgi:hypothetical protein
MKRNKTERNKERKGSWYWDIAAFGFVFSFSLFSLILREEKRRVTGCVNELLGVS